MQPMIITRENNTLKATKNGMSCTYAWLDPQGQLVNFTESALRNFENAYIRVSVIDQEKMQQAIEDLR